MIEHVDTILGGVALLHHILLTAVGIDYGLGDGSGVSGGAESISWQAMTNTGIWIVLAVLAHVLLG